MIFLLMIRRQPKSTQSRSSAASDVYKRQALGNPWVFRNVARGVDQEPSLEQRFQVIRIHVARQVAYAGEFMGIREMRKHLGWYLRGLKGSAMVREKLHSMKTEQDVLSALSAYQEALTSGRATASQRDFEPDAFPHSRYGV